MRQRSIGPDSIGPATLSPRPARNPTPSVERGILRWRARVALAAVAAAIGLVFIADQPGWAAQALIPTPYPSAVSGGAPLDPEPMTSGGPQSIMKDPYPQQLGDTAQGNPPISRTSRHQHLVQSIYQRKYRVDRP